MTGKASIEGNPAVIAVCDGRFLMASMGQVVGEKDHKSGGTRHKRNSSR